MNLPKKPATLPFEMGKIIGTILPFLVSLKDLAIHALLLGASGSGKSSCLQILIQFFMISGIGKTADGRGIPFTFCDPHGDIATRLMAFALRLAKKITGLFKWLHFLEIGPDCAFALDPAARMPGRAEVGNYRYYSLLNALATRIVATFLRRVSEADASIMNRMKRWLKNAVIFCTVDYIGNNTHLGLDKLLVALDPDHDDFPGYYEKVAPFLPDYVRRDYEKMIGTKRDQDRERWTESAINRLREILPPPVLMIFGQHAPSIDFFEIIRRGESVILSFPEDLDITAAEKHIIIGFVINEVLFAKRIEARRFPEAQRRQHFLIIDEAGEVIGEDLRLALGAVRKYKLPIILGAQNLEKLVLGDVQLCTEVIEQCQAKLIFQLQEYEGLEKVTKDVALGNIDYTERVSERQMQRGWTPMQSEEHSIGRQKSKSKGTGGSEAQTKTKTKTTTKTASDTWNEGESSADGDSDVETGSNSRAIVYTPDGMRQNLSANNSGSKSHADTHTDTKNKSKGGGASNAEAEGESLALQQAKNWTEGETEGLTHTIAYKTMLLANLVPEWEPNGQLEAGPESAQWGRLMQTIHAQNPGEAFVKLPKQKKAVQVKMHLVEAAFHGTANEEAAAAAKKLAWANKPYIFSPNAVDAKALPHPLDLPKRKVEADQPMIVGEENSGDNPMF